MGKRQPSQIAKDVKIKMFTLRREGWGCGGTTCWGIRSWGSQLGQAALKVATKLYLFTVTVKTRGKGGSGSLMLHFPPWNSTGESEVNTGQSESPHWRAHNRRPRSIYEPRARKWREREGWGGKSYWVESATVQISIKEVLAQMPRNFLIWGQQVW